MKTSKKPAARLIRLGSARANTKAGIQGDKNEQLMIGVYY